MVVLVYGAEEECNESERKARCYGIEGRRKHEYRKVDEGTSRWLNYRKGGRLIAFKRAGEGL